MRRRDPDLMARPAPYSQLTVAGEHVYLSGVIAQDDPAWRARRSSAAEETVVCLRLIERLLGEVGLTLADVVQTTVHMVDLDQFEAMNAAYAPFFPPDAPPARTCVGVARLLAGAQVEITCVARRQLR